MSKVAFHFGNALVVSAENFRTEKFFKKRFIGHILRKREPLADKPGASVSQHRLTPGLFRNER